MDKCRVLRANFCEQRLVFIDIHPTTGNSMFLVLNLEARVTGCLILGLIWVYLFLFPNHENPLYFSTLMVCGTYVD